MRHNRSGEERSGGERSLYEVNKFNFRAECVQKQSQIGTGRVFREIGVEGIKLTVWPIYSHVIIPRTLYSAFAIEFYIPCS